MAQLPSKMLRMDMSYKQEKAREEDAIGRVQERQLVPPGRGQRVARAQRHVECQGSLTPGGYSMGVGVLEIHKMGFGRALA